MKSPITTWPVALILALGPAQFAFADGDFTCGGHIIEQGMELEQVKEYCGPPTDDTGDTWVYDRGPDELIVIIHVEADGTVGDIENQPHE